MLLYYAPKNSFGFMALTQAENILHVEQPVLPVMQEACSA